MKKKLYLHIGTPKSGTTAIQNFLYDNRDKLAECGIEYPCNRTPFGEYSWTDGNIGFMFGIGMEDAEKIAKGVIELCDKCEGSTILCSTERIWAQIADKKKFFKVLKDYGFNIKVIVYLREQSDYLDSIYREGVKAPPHVAFPYEQMFKFDSEPECNVFWWKHIIETSHYYQYLCDIDSVVGKENISVRVYDKEHWKDGNIFADFLEAINIDKDVSHFKIPSKRINPSLSHSQMSIMCKLNKLKLNNYSTDEELLGILFSDMSKISALDENGINIKSLLSNADREAIMNEYAVENRCIAKEYLGSNGELFTKKSKVNADDDTIKVTEKQVLDSLILLWGIGRVTDFRKINDIYQRLNNQHNIIKYLEDYKKTKRGDVGNIDELRYKAAAYDALVNSNSWQITAPLRVIGKLVRKLFRR